ncbi:histidine phosphatase family protein [Halomicronema sp. CCY15110]|uniref:histidine phosphatase family protein n=1 Tax=Halomicronema sp. CCY15110 TaxID=2767773 RepID=UPI001951AF4F|nr:histidine phosphatase family protein [Halomicronema sp. CCY15110]
MRTRSLQLRYLLFGLLAVGLLTGCVTRSSESDLAAGASESAALTEPPEPHAAAPSDTPVRPADAQSITVTAAPTPLTPEALWQQLQQPGETLYVVLLRHALAPGTGDPANFQLGDCSTQRNLSAEGRAQAAAIGQAFRDRGVAVQQVLSSQWCRCLATAELMNLGDVTPEPALNSFFRDRRTAEAQTLAVKQSLLTQAERPGVIVMVTHQVNITGLTGIVPRSGEAVVVQVAETGLTQIGQFLPAP